MRDDVAAPQPPGRGGAARGPRGPGGRASPSAAWGSAVDDPACSPPRRRSGRSAPARSAPRTWWTPYLARAGDDRWGAYLTLDPEGARARARGDRRRRAAGDPPPRRPAPRREGRALAPATCPPPAGSRILEGYRPLYTATCVARLRGGRRHRRRQDQHGRVRDGLVARRTRPTRSRATPGTPSACPAAPAAARPRRWPRAMAPLVARHRHRRLDPPAGRALRDRRAEAHLRRGLALRAGRVRLLARPGRPVRAHGQGRRAPAVAPASATTRCDSTSLEWPEPIRARPRATARRPARRRRDGADGGEGIEPGVRAAVERGAGRWSRISAATVVRRSSLPHAEYGAGHVLPDRPGRGARPTWPASTACATGMRATRRTTALEHVRAHARRGLRRRRSSGASCSAPTRWPRATTTRTTCGRSRCAR